MAELTTTTVRVLIVDDESLLRAGLRLMLDGTAGIVIVGEAADGAEALDAVDRTAPDLVLMDIQMPGVDGIEATRRLRAEHPELPIVVLTTFDTEEFVFSALQAGATGFLLKDIPPRELVGAVRSAATGHIMLSPSVTKRVVAAAVQTPEPQRRGAARTRLSSLTVRELEVAEAVAEGLTNDEIGQRLFLAPTTVKSHVAHVMSKLAVQNRVQIAICVHEAQG